MNRVDWRNFRQTPPASPRYCASPLRTDRRTISDAKRSRSGFIARRKIDRETISPDLLSESQRAVILGKLQEDTCPLLLSAISPTVSIQIEGAANTSSPIPIWMTTHSGFLMRMVSGSNLVASTSRLEDSASF